MSIPDLINGLFELCGGLFLVRNCIHLHRDKQVKGVSILSTAFFSAWGYWNLYYYPFLNQWMSFCGGLLIVIANTWWVTAALYYRKRLDQFPSQC